ncbi:photosystem reaction center subunit H (plasmid) [Deinococcus aetherius]|uniref:Photosystem reaction center subunit H n=1 Tax=Deinococcus aetherius TaxID=200252 RepID=A0ABM8AK08_9DEIO|nr:PRC-barrel domain-containing protein [Deinococcus aetherius]BDP44154.1 photosystem reaction center subunit H [Deinococcus aetherius]
MTQDTGDHVLIRLSDTDLTLSQQGEDIRDRKVVDRHGDEIGHVSALFVDPREKRVRMLQVGAGGFLGLGERHFLLPVEAVTRVTRDEVHVDQTRERVVNSPRYDPDLIVRPNRDFWEPYYGYYGTPPFWVAGYLPPPPY